MSKNWKLIIETDSHSRQQLPAYTKIKVYSDSKKYYIEIVARAISQGLILKMANILSNKISIILNPKTKIIAIFLKLENAFSKCMVDKQQISLNFMSFIKRIFRRKIRALGYWLRWICLILIWVFPFKCNSFVIKRKIIDAKERTATRTS